MKIKVCGLSNSLQNEAINQLSEIDFTGFIFYEGSKRNTTTTLNTSKKKVGVFVNETTEKIQEIIKREKLFAVQLHGDESVQQCLDLSEKTIIIKAFNIETKEDLKACELFENKVDFFLFDSKSTQRGGSGKSFDWSILQYYKGNTPFFLSGGIGIDEVEKIKNIKNPLLYGIDINSRFELAPKQKNIPLIATFIKKLNS